MSELYYYIPLCFAMFAKDQTKLGGEFYEFLKETIDNSSDNTVRYLLFWLSKIDLIRENQYTTIFGTCTRSLLYTSFFLDELADKRDVNIGDEFMFPQDVNDVPVYLSDPIWCMKSKIESVEVIKIFDSKLRPLLLRMHYSSSILNYPVDTIFKVGDDLTQDFHVQILFSVFNTIWKESNLVDKPFIKQYRVLPTGENHGLVEFVKSKSIEKHTEKDWEYYQQFSEPEKKHFILSLAGSFVAGYVLGIRDRHRDNMLISRKGEFFHIDFGHIFNDSALIDGPVFAIPAEIKYILNEEEWEYFITMCIEAFLQLRQNLGIIIIFCTNLFKNIDEKFIRTCLDQVFSIRDTEPEVRTIIRSSVEAGVKSNLKYLKDWFHRLGQSRNGSSS
jgi:hypothetical protein